jgi:hypothetical protein
VARVPRTPSVWSKAPSDSGQLAMNSLAPTNQAHNLKVVGSNPTPATIYVGVDNPPVSGLIRLPFNLVHPALPDYESGGRGFESCPVRHSFKSIRSSICGLTRIGFAYQLDAIRTARVMTV